MNDLVSEDATAVEKLFQEWNTLFLERQKELDEQEMKVNSWEVHE